MAVITNIISSKFYNRINNGDSMIDNLADFAPNLAGNAGESCRAVIDNEIIIESFSSAQNVFTVNQPSPGSDFILTQELLNFTDEGFKAGDRFSFERYYDLGPQTFTGDIVSINRDGRDIQFTLNTGSVTPGFNTTEYGIRRIFLGQEYKGAVLNFGLIENNETTNYLNKTTGEEQQYYFINDSGLESGTNVGTPKGVYNSWVTNAMNLLTSGIGTTKLRVEIFHNFIINPYYREGESDDISNGILRPEYDNGNSLKYVWQCNLREEIVNPNSELTFGDSETNGSVGDFGENFNGLDNNYAIQSIDYTDVISGDIVESLQIGKKTRIRINVTKIGGIEPATRFGLIHSYLPAQAEYTNTRTFFRQNLIYSELYHTDSDPISTGATEIKSLNSTINAGVLEITAEIEFAVEQQLRLLDTSEYLLTVSISDPNLSAASSDRVNLVAQLSNYTSASNVDELVSVNSFGFLQLGQQKGDLPSPSLETWNEDGLLANVDFKIDLAKNAFINSLQMLLVAHNEQQNSFFQLDSFDFPLGSGVISNGVQEFNIDQERGYPLGTADAFNEVSFKTGMPISNFQGYELFIAQKIAWEDWIRNLNADTVFFNNTKPNDNLNFLSSNYSQLEGYKVKMLMRIGLSGVDNLGKDIVGISNQFSQEIVVSDYNEDKLNTPFVWSAQFKTFTEDGTQELGLTDARLNLLSGQNTLFRIIWTNSIAPVTDIAGILAVNRIQQENDSGKQIFELSNDGVSPILVTNPLKGISGNYLAPYIQGGQVYCDVIIDASRIAPNTAYKLSGKINL